MFFRKDRPKADSRAGLLTPWYQPTQHKVYVDHLFSAVVDSPAKNIAVAGQYGTGKSSVLLGLADRLKKEKPKLKVISVSLSTLDAEQAARRVQEANDGDVPAVTNLIQKEIVKQLIYRERPSHTPRSRFKRLQATRRRTLLAWSVAAALLAFFAVRFVLPTPTVMTAVMPWVAATVAACLPYIFLRVTGRISISELKATAASLTLKDYGSWFDQYLDEIVYFFDLSRCRVAIFEDLDRFNDPHIFETLRELNILLNSMEQLKEKAGPIRFIYAARDSVFTADQSTKAGVGTPGDVTSPAANRIKFFDVVVPLVPFVTPQTSRGHLIEQLDKAAHPPSQEVIDVVAHAITDMRLIVNIAHEYGVFEAIVLGDGALRGLTPDRLFAMVVFKNLYPHEFDKIMAGTSKLNDVHGAFREAIDQLAAQAVQDLKAIDAAVGTRHLPEPERARLGDGLAALLEMLNNISPGYTIRATTNSAVSFDRRDPSSETFWGSVFERGGIVLTRTNGYPAVSYSLDQLAPLFGMTLVPDEWLAAGERELEQRRAAILERRNLIARATMVDLLARPDLRYAGGNGQDACHFEHRVRELLPGMDLVVDLLRQGFIDEHFTLYAGRYHSTAINASAQNFIMLVINAHDPQPLIRYTFTAPEADIPQVLREAGTAFLRDERCFNLQLFDYLLTHTTEGDQSLQVLASETARSSSFVEAYLEEGAQPELLVRKLAATWVKVFEYLAAAAHPADRLSGWLDAALAGASRKVAYRSNLAVVEQIRTQWAALTSLRDDSVDAKDVASTLTTLQVKAPVLVNLAPGLRREIALRDGYDLTAENLRAVCDTDHFPALDEVAAPFQPYIHANLADYAALLAAQPNASAVRDNANVGSTIDQLAERLTALPPDLQDAIIGTAGNGDLAQAIAPSALWPAMVRTGRLQPSANNLLAYLREYPKAGLAHWTARLADLPSIDGIDTLAEADRIAIASPLLAEPQIPASQRLRLAEAMHLEGLTTDQLQGDAIPLIPRLVETKIVPDDPQTFTHLQQHADPETRVAFFQVSDQFPGFIDQVSITRSDLDAVAQSASIANVRAVLGATSALEAVETDQVHFWAKNALSMQCAISVESLKALAGAAAEDDMELIIPLIAGEAGNLHAEEFRQILDALPGEYPQLGRTSVDLPLHARPLILAAKAAGLVGRHRTQSDHVRALPPRLG